MTQPNALEILKQYWGYDSFRGHQKAIIDSVLNGNDTIGLLPTGGGKSICYQIPGLIFPGLTMVISPLIALMEDQHNGLIKRDIKSFHFKGSYSPRSLDEAFRNLRYGNYKFAFFAPERIANPLFLEYIKHAHVSLLAIDEAHCISQWGFDFRPSYLNVRILRELRPEIPVLALTASATARVKRDLHTQLNIPEAQLFEGSIRRDNLHLQLKFTPNKERQLLRLLPTLLGTGIIYAKTRKSCEVLSALLTKHGHSSCFFHAGLSGDLKSLNQSMWIENKVKVMVATTAFGMGIDKGDVGWVIHWDAPDTLEGYYQEIGRAGRNGFTSLTYLLYHQYDIARLQKTLSEVPNIAAVEEFYRSFCSKHQIAVGTGDQLKVQFSIVSLAEKFKLSIPTLLTYIRLLQHRGLWQFIESDRSVPKFSITSSIDTWDRLTLEDRELLTTLARTYPNATHTAHRIDLKRFAAMMHFTIDHFKDKLGELTQRGLIAFESEQSGSAVLFMQPRPSNKSLTFPKNFIDAWLSSKVERTTSMLKFLHSSDCLVQQIETYFDQGKSEPCGACSSCIHNYYPDQEKVKEMVSNGLSLDDIWFDLNCSPDELRF